MNRFFVYEEYGAKYQLMVRDVAGAHRTMPGWLSYQKGLEVLAASLDSAASHRGHAKKSLTIGDLLVKVGDLSPPKLGPELTSTAHPTRLQVPASLLRVVEAYTRDRLPTFPHGGRKCARQTPRGYC